MKKEKLSINNVTYTYISDGDGDIPAFVMGPPEVYIPHLSDNLKKHFTFYGINFPWKQKLDDYIENAPSLDQLRTMNGYLNFYSEIFSHLCEKINKPRFVMFAFSILGLIADQFVYKYPEQTCGAVLLCPPPAMDHQVKEDNEKIMNVGPDEALDVEDVEAQVLNDYLQGIIEEAHKDYASENLALAGHQLWKNGIDNIDLQLILFNELLPGHRLAEGYQPSSATNKPILLVSGKDDKRILLESFNGIVLPDNYQHNILPGRHMLHHEEQIAFDKCILDWLTKHDIRQHFIYDETTELV